MTNNVIIGNVLDALGGTDTVCLNFRKAVNFDRSCTSYDFFLLFLDANLFCFIVYYIIKHPNFWAKLHQEIKSIFGDGSVNCP